MGEWDFGTYYDDSDEHRAAADEMRAALGLPPRDREAEDQAAIDALIARAIESGAKALASLDELEAILDDEPEDA